MHGMRLLFPSVRPKRPLVQTNNKLARSLAAPRIGKKLQEQKAKEGLELKEAEERKEAATNE